MDPHKITTLILSISVALLLSYATAVRQCRKCGPNPVPYPLSTAPDCGDPGYNIRCTAGTLWFDALGGSSYMIRSIDPLTRRIVIKPAALAGSACVSTDFRSEGMYLNETLLFSIAAGNTIFLFNCTDNAPHAPPMDCSASNLCHSYITDHAKAGACGRVNICCGYKTGGVLKEYVVRVHSGGCAAYQSFVDFNATVAPPGTRWPEPGLGIEWVAPQEPVCKGPMDCNELLNSKCGVGPSGGVQRCFCNAGFKWDSINGSCQPQIQRHGKDIHCKVRKKKKMLLAVVVALGGMVSIITVLGAIFYKKHNQAKIKTKETKIKRRKEISSAKANALSSRIFTGREIKKATNNFSPENLIGSGGFGEVFKGTFDDGTTIAIKRAKLGNTKGIDQMQNEVRILCQVNHRSLVRLLGCCLELEHPLLIYEYISNGTLFDYLHRHSLGTREPLKWHQRLKIAHQTAEGLSYLHSAAVPPIYHRDVKSSNILLDDKLDAKVSDFGLSRLVELAEENKSHIFTSAQGTLGYLDPEYYRNFQLTDKSDVYSFGVVLMELLTAQKAIDFNREEENVNLAVYAKKKMFEDMLMDVVDPLLKEGACNLELETMKSLGYLAAACLDDQRQKRPSMKEVADEIEYLIKIVKVPSYKDKVIGLKEIGLVLNVKNMPKSILEDCNIIPEYEEKVGAYLRSMVKVDSYTSLLFKGKIARICVGIDLRSKLVPTFKVLGQEFKVEHEGLHLICFSCSKYGYRQEQCIKDIGHDFPEIEKGESNNNSSINSEGMLGKNLYERKDMVIDYPKIESGLKDDHFGPWMSAIVRKENKSRTTSTGVKVGMDVEKSLQQDRNLGHRIQDLIGLNSNFLWKDQDTSIKFLLDKPLDPPLIMKLDKIDDNVNSKSEIISLDNSNAGLSQHPEDAAHFLS
ncbi:wall-associated receptor kinase-like 20 [Abrus precatorius]|uniref:Wall-associated receptor kinase-like 20 n=1 Tax=Abrus precatorius TaxID=3816 RepID=A0A8B8L7G1_ABRPR|nr:wall-associated receptor kinase-like 20 [Abrus precatorius]